MRYRCQVRFIHVDGTCMIVRQTLQRHFVRGGYEQKIHDVVPDSQGVGVEEVGAIGKVYIAVGF